jgi:hypothetical protein
MEAMTGKKTKAQDALDRLADTLVDDILCASDEDILAEVKEDGGDAVRHAAGLRAHFERSVIVASKSKLEAAKAGVAQNRASGIEPAPPTDMAKARATLRRLMTQPEATAKLTMAARKESELSDADVVGLLEDLRALGVAIPGDKGDRTH